MAPSPVDVPQANVLIRRKFIGEFSDNDDLAGARRPTAGLWLAGNLTILVDNEQPMCQRWPPCAMLDVLCEPRRSSKLS